MKGYIYYIDLTGEEKIFTTGIINDIPYEEMMQILENTANVLRRKDNKVKASGILFVDK